MTTQHTTPSPDHTLAELATTRAGASRVFLRHKLDFCCGGQVSLADACQQRDLAVDELIAEIEAEDRQQETPELWNDRPVIDLVDHILTRFHEKHREDVPRLIEMARKVERVHADKPTVPKGLTAFLEGMQVALEDHMGKEEQILFPMIKSGGHPMIAQPIMVMEAEHQEHGQNLKRLRALVTDFEPPAEACGTWRALYLGLAELEGDLMSHIHLENYVLFPRVVGR